jgi:hypothetical protein
MPIKCPHCCREFIRKHNYNKHIESCQFIIKKECDLNAELEDTIDIPNYKDLYNFVLNLSMRVKKVEEENVKLKNKVLKLDPVQWLNDNRTCFEYFNDWYKLIDVSEHLDIALSNDLNTAIVSALSSYITNESPIFSFDNKKNIFFVFNNDTWEELSFIATDLFINHVANLFIVEFDKYLDTHQYLINDPKYIDTYVNYQNKIYGQSNIINRNQKIKTTLYEKIKHSVLYQKVT